MLAQARTIRMSNFKSDLTREDKESDSLLEETRSNIRWSDRRRRLERSMRHKSMIMSGFCLVAKGSEKGPRQEEKGDRLSAAERSRRKN